MEKPWLKFYDPPVPRTMEIPDIPLFRILENTADPIPKKPAIYGLFGGKMNYGELRNQMNLFTQALINLGFQKGERLGTSCQHAAGGHRGLRGDESGGDARFYRSLD